MNTFDSNQWKSIHNFTSFADKNRKKIVQFYIHEREVVENVPKIISAHVMRRRDCTRAQALLTIHTKLCIYTICRVECRQYRVNTKLSTGATALILFLCLFLASVYAIRRSRIVASDREFDLILTQIRQLHSPSHQFVIQFKAEIYDHHSIEIGAIGRSVFKVFILFVTHSEMDYSLATTY